jgi:hypothetical protein
MTKEITIPAEPDPLNPQCRYRVQYTVTHAYETTIAANSEDEACEKVSFWFDWCGEAFVTLIRTDYSDLAAEELISVAIK